MNHANRLNRTGPTSKISLTTHSPVKLGGKNERDSNCEQCARPSWTNGMDFVFSLIGYAVGVGNIWRFPYLCYRNGGGAFLIPYWLMLFSCGIPLFFLEVAMGQFSSRGAIKVWNICPLFKGVGIGTLIVTAIASLYYNLLIALILYFLFASFASALPWGHCNNVWNTDACIILKNLNSTAMLNADLHTLKTSSYEFWHYRVLQISEGLHQMGAINWRLMLCFILAWILTYLCLIRGIKSTGKIVYLTATFPYVMLTVLLVRSLMLPGSFNGLLFFLKPDWKILMSFKVWNEAATQIFYSLGPGWSGLITMASYNKFRNNCLRDSFIVSIVNCGTSVYAGLVVFSVVGFMSHILNVPIDKVATQGVGLAFIVYPESLLYLPFSSFWSILFFLMLFTVGIDTMFVSLEVLYSAIFDELPARYKKNASLFNLLASIALMFLGFPFILQGGIYLFQLVDWHLALISVILFCLIETVVITWVYGGQRFIEDIEFMFNRKLYAAKFWLFVWSYLIPVILVIVLVFNVVFHVPVQYGKYVYPPWALTIGWCISFVSVLPIPGYAVYLLLKSPTLTLKEAIKLNLKPTIDWGPALEPYKTVYFCTNKRLSPELNAHFKKFMDANNSSNDASLLYGNDGLNQNFNNNHNLHNDTTLTNVP